MLSLLAAKKNQQNILNSPHFFKGTKNCFAKYCLQKSFNLDPLLLEIIFNFSCTEIFEVITVDLCNLELDSSQSRNCLVTQAPGSVSVIEENVPGLAKAALLHHTCALLHCTCTLLHLTWAPLHCTCELLHCTCALLHCTCELLHCTCELLHWTCEQLHCTCALVGNPTKGFIQ